MAIKYIYNEKELAAKEEGVLQAASGVVRTGEVETTPQEKIASLYSQSTGKTTSKETLLKSINLRGQSFNDYYKNGGYIPQGFEDTARTLSIEEKRKSAYDEVLDGKKGYEDFLMDTYGKDLMKTSDYGIDLSNPVYWYNRYKEGNFGSPLDNDLVYTSILESSEKLLKEEEWYKESATNDLSDTLLGNQVEKLVGTSITGETFKSLFPEVTESMSEAFDNDINKMLTYYKAGYLQGVFSPYIDTNGDGIYEYVLMTDGVLYNAQEDDVSLGTRNTVQINYKKNDDGSYATDENKNRLVDSVEKRGWFGTSDTGQWFNSLTGGVVSAVSSVADIFGLATIGLMDVFDAQKSFGDYYAAYEAMKNSSSWSKVANNNNIMYDEAEQSKSLKTAATIGTVLEFVGEAVIIFATSGAAAAFKAGEQAAREAGKAGGAVLKAGLKAGLKQLAGKAVVKETGEEVAEAAGKAVAKQTMKTVGRRIVEKAAIGTIAGAATGAASASLLKADVGKGTLIGAGAGAVAGTISALTGFDVGKFLFKESKAVYKLARRTQRGAAIFSVGNSAASRLILDNIQSAIILSVRDGLDSYGTLQAQNKVLKATGQEALENSQVLGKAMVTTLASFLTTAVLRAASESTFSSRLGALTNKTNGAFGAFKDDALLNSILLKQSRNWKISLIDNACDILENTITMGISQWGNSIQTDKSMFDTILSTAVSPNALIMNGYVGLVNLGGMSRFGNTGIGGDKASAYRRYAYNTDKKYSEVVLEVADRAVKDLLKENEYNPAAVDTIMEFYGDYNSRRLEAIKMIEEDLTKSADTITYDDNGKEKKLEVSEATINLYMAKILDEKLAKFLPEDNVSGTAYVAKLKEIYQEKINALKGMKSNAAKNEVKMYEAIIKSLSNLAKGQSVVDTIQNTYMKSNYANFKKENYYRLMNDIVKEQQVYATYVKSLTDGRAAKTIKDIVGKDEYSQFYGNLAQDILSRIFLKNQASRAHKGVAYDDENFKSLQKYVEESGLLNPKKAVDFIKDRLIDAAGTLLRYANLNNDGIYEKDIDEAFNGTTKIFKSGTFTPSMKIKYTDTNEIESCDYEANEELKNILSSKENIEKLIALNIIKIEADESSNAPGFKSALSNAYYIKLNQEQLNEYRANPKYKSIINMLDALAEASEKDPEDGGLDYDTPLVVKLTSKYTNSEGKEVDDTVYVIPAFNDFDFAKKMNLVPSILTCMYTAASSSNSTKVSRALTELGLMLSEETSMCNSDDLKDEAARKAYRLAGFSHMIKYFDFNDTLDDKGHIKSDSNNIVSRLQLIRLLTPTADAEGNITSVITREDLDEIIANCDKTTDLDTISKVSDLKTYLNMMDEYEEIRVLSASYKNGNTLKKSEKEKIRDFIAKCMNIKNHSSSIYSCMVNDGIFSDKLHKSLYEMYISQNDNSFQKEQNDTGQIIKQTITKELTSSLNLSKKEADIIAEGIAEEYIATITDYSRTDFKAAKDKAYKNINQNINRFTNKFYDEFQYSLAKEDTIKDYLRFALKHPGEPNTVDISKLTPKEKDKLDEFIESNSNYIHNNIATRYTASDYKTMWIFYKTFYDTNIGLEEFTNNLKNGINLNDFLKMIDNKYVSETISQMKKEQYKANIEEKVQKALDYINTDTIDIEPSFVTTIYLNKIMPKEVSDIIDKLALTQRRTKALDLKDVGDEIKKSLGGLTPYQMKVISDYIIKGKTKLIFDLSNPEDIVKFNSFINGIGYDVPNPAQNMPEIDGVEYNTTYEKGMEVSLSYKGEADVKKVASVIANALHSADSKYRIQYTSSDSKVTKDETNRLNALAQDIVYITPDSIIKNPVELFVAGPTDPTTAKSTVAKSESYIKLMTKQGVSASILADNIKRTVLGYALAGEQDSELLVGLRIYDIIQKINNYYTEDNVKPIHIEQLLTKEAADEAASVLKNSSLYTFTSVAEGDKVRIIIDLKQEAKDNFVELAFKEINASVNDSKNPGVIDLRKIIPYFNLMEAPFGKDEEYSSLTKGGRDFDQYGNTGDETTLSNEIMSQCKLTFDELATILRQPLSYNYTMDFSIKETNLSAKQLIDKYSKSKNLFDAILVSMLKTGIEISKRQMANANMELSNTEKVYLYDYNTRVAIGKALNRAGGDTTKAYDILTSEGYALVKPQAKVPEVNVSSDATSSQLKYVEADNKLVFSKDQFTKDNLDNIVNFLNKTILVDNPELAIYGGIKENPLLDLQNALEIKDGKFIIKLDNLSAVSREAVKALNELGIQIDKTNYKKIKDKINAYDDYDLEYFTELRGLSYTEVQGSLSMRDSGFTEFEPLLSRLTLNRLRNIKGASIKKASSIASYSEDDDMDKIIKAYITHINRTAYRNSSNAGSLRLFNLSDELGFRDFVLSLNNGVKALSTATYTKKDPATGEVLETKKIINEQDLFNVSSAIMLFTQGTDFSSEFTDTLVYVKDKNGGKGRIEQFSQRYEYDLDFNRQMLIRESLFNNDDEVVLIKINKNVLNPNNKANDEITYMVLDSAEAKEYYRKKAAVDTYNAFKIKYSHLPEFKVEDAIKYTLENVVTNKDINESRASVLKDRLGMSELSLPESVKDALYPMIENTQVSSEGVNLSTEAFRNSIDISMLEVSSDSRNNEIRTFNDMVIYGTTYEALPDNVKDTISHLQSEMVDKTTPEYKYVEAFLNNDVEQMKLQATAILAKEDVDLEEVFPKIIYTLMLTRLSGKDLNALFMNNKKMKNILNIELTDEYNRKNLPYKEELDNLKQKSSKESTAIDFETIYMKGQTPEQQLPTEMSILAVPKGTHTDIFNRAKNSTKYSVYIRQDVSTVEASEGKDESELLPNKQYYKSQEAFDNYKKVLASNDSGVEKVEADGSVTIVFDSTKDAVVWFNNKGFSDNLITFNGKDFDDIILKANGFNVNETKQDIYEEIRTYSSGLTNDEMSYTLDNLKQKILDDAATPQEIKDYFMTLGKSHTASVDTVSMYLVLQKFIDSFDSISEMRSSLTNDILNIAKQFGLSKDDILKWKSNFNFSKDIQTELGKDYYIVDYQKYGDTLTNEILKRSTLAFNSYLNSVALKANRAREEDVLTQLYSGDIEHLRNLYDSTQRARNKSIITKLISIVTAATQKDSTAVLDKDVLFNYNFEANTYGGIIKDTSILLDKIITQYGIDNHITGKKESLQKFFEQTTEAQENYIISFATNHKNKCSWIVSDAPAIVVDEQLKNISNIKGISENDSPQFYENIKSYYNTKISESLPNNYMVSALQKDSKRATVGYAVSLFMDKVIDKVNTFLPEGTPQTIKDEIARLCSDIYGQTKEQEERTNRVSEADRGTKIKVDSIYEQILTDRNGEKITVGQKILDTYKERMRTSRVYGKVTEAKPGSMNGYLYISREFFVSRYNVQPEEMAEAYYGDKDAPLYASTIRHPGFKSDNYHILPIIIVESGNPISMTATTAEVLKGDFDGDGVSLEINKDICNFGHKISPYTNVAFNLLNSIEALGLDNSTNSLALKPENFINLHNLYDTELIRLYELIENNPNDIDAIRAEINTLKALITKDEDKYAKDFWKIYGVEEADNSLLDNKQPYFFTRGQLCDSDSTVAKNYAKLKQETSIFWDINKIRDQSGYLHKQQILSGQRIDITKKAQPFTYTPICIPEILERKIDLSFTDIDKLKDDLIAIISDKSTPVDNLIAIISNKPTPIKVSNIDNISKIIKGLSNASPSQIVNTFIRLVQQDVVTSPTYKDTIIEAFQDSEAKTDAFNSEMDYYTKMNDLGKAYNINFDTDEEATLSDTPSIFEVQRKSAYMMDKIMGTQDIYRQSRKFEGKDTDKMESLLLNIALDKYANNTSSAVKYVDLNGNDFQTSSYEIGNNGLIKTNTYVNSKKLKVMVTDKLPENINFINPKSNVYTSTLSNIKLGLTETISKEAIYAYKNNKPMNHTGLTNETNAKACSEYYISGLYDSSMRLLDPSKAYNLSSAKYISVSHRKNIGEIDGTSTTKVIITGTGMGKGLLYPADVIKSYGITQEDIDSCDMIVSTSTLKASKDNPALKVLGNAEYEYELSTDADGNSTNKVKRTLYNNVPISVVEDTAPWSDSLKNKPIDTVTITNGRTNADGMLQVGKFTYGVDSDGKFYYDSTNVAKLSELTSSYYSRDYNNVNSARLYNILRAVSLINYIPDSEMSPDEKQYNIKNIVYNVYAGSDEYGNTFIKYLQSKYLKKEKFDAFIKYIESDKTLKTLWSSQMMANYVKDYANAIDPSEKGSRSKKEMALDATNTYYAESKPEGYFPESIDAKSSGYRDVTFGSYDMLSFINDIGHSIDPEMELIPRMAREATDLGILGKAKQFKGSLSNEFGSMSTLDSVEAKNYLAGKGTRKTGNNISDTVNQNNLSLDKTVLSDEQFIELTNKYNNHSTESIEREYTYSDYKKSNKVYPSTTLTTMLSLLYPAKNIEELAYATNSTVRNAQVNNSPKYVRAKDGEIVIAMHKTNKEVPIGKVKKEMNSSLPPSNYRDIVAKASDTLESTLSKSKLIPSSVPTAEDYFGKLSTLFNSKEANLFTSLRYEDNVAYMDKVDKVSKELLKQSNAILKKEASVYFKSLFNLDTSNASHKSFLTSSGVKGKGTYIVDRLIQGMSNTYMRTANDIGGEDLPKLVEIFLKPEYKNDYIDFNKFAYAYTYMLLIEEANAGLDEITKGKGNNLFTEKYTSMKEKGLEGLKQLNLSVKDATDFIEKYQRGNKQIANSLINIFNRLNEKHNELYKALGVVDQNVFRSLVKDKQTTKYGYQLRSLQDSKSDILNVLADEMDSVSKRYAQYMYTKQLKESGKMSNIPVIAKVTELSDTAIDNISRLPNSEDSDSLAIVSVLISQAKQLGITLDLSGKMTNGKVLAEIYRKTYQSIHNENFKPYADIAKDYAENKNNPEAENMILKYKLLESVLGSISFMVKDKTSQEANAIKHYLTTDIFNSVMEDERLKSGKFILTDSNGKPLYTLDKKGGYVFDGAYKFAASFVNANEFLLYASKYTNELSSVDDIKFNIVTAMINGDAYMMEKVIADSNIKVNNQIVGMPKDLSILGKAKDSYQKFAQKYRNVLASLIMSMPFKLPYKILTQYVWDFGTFLGNDLSYTKNINKATKEMAQYIASNGKVTNEKLDLFISLGGYNPFVTDTIAGEEGAKPINKNYFKATASAYNFQHYHTRYAEFLNLYDAAMANGGKIPPEKSGSAYYKIKEINNTTIKPSTNMSKKDLEQYNVASRCLAVIAENMGTSGDMPSLAKPLGEWGFMFTTFPLAAMRGGVGKLKSLGVAVTEAFLKSSDKDEKKQALKYIFVNQGGSLAATVLISALLTIGIEALFGEKDEDENDEERINRLINDYVFNGAVINPFDSLMKQKVVSSKYQQRDLAASLYNMFIDPYVEATKDNDDDTNIGTASWQILMENVFSHIPFYFKDVIESVPSNTTLQSMANVYNSDSSFFENLIRKLSGYALGNEAATTFTNSYSSNKYSDKAFLEKVGEGFGNSMQTLIANNKTSKSNWKTYTNAKSIIFDYISAIYDEDESTEDSTYKKNPISSEINKIIKNGKSPEVLYNYILDYLQEGYTPDRLYELRKSLRNCSLQNKIESLNQTTLLNNLTEVELSTIQKALVYEKANFPFLNEAYDYIDDLYNQQYKAEYEELYGVKTPTKSALSTVNQLLYNYRAYNNSNYNYKYKSNYINYYRNYFNNYTSYKKDDSVIDYFMDLNYQREKELSNIAYRQRQKEWSK